MCFVIVAKRQHLSTQGAAQFQQTYSLTTHDAWRHVWEEAGGNSKQPELTQLLVRQGAYSGCTTSGVEHVHGKHDWLFTSRRGRLMTARELDEIKIVPCLVV